MAGNHIFLKIHVFLDPCTCTCLPTTDRSIGGGGRRRVRFGRMDYNAEIPFLHEPKPGYFSTDKEDEREARERANASFKPKLLAELEAKRRNAEEIKLRKRDINDLKDRVKKGMDRKESYHHQSRLIFVGETLEEIKAKQDAQIKRRSALVIPAPVMSDAEMAEIAKMGTDTMDIDGGSDATKVHHTNSYSHTHTTAYFRLFSTITLPRHPFVASLAVVELVQQHPWSLEHQLVRTRYELKLRTFGL